MEDLDPSNTIKGVDCTPFKIKLNKRVFGHGDIITYDKFNGKELYITDEDILDMGDGFIYTVQMPNNDSAATFDNRFLTNNTYFFRVGSARGEYGERYSDLSMTHTTREFYNYVGNADAHVHYTI